MANSNPTPPQFTKQDIERFWSKVDKTPGQGPKGTCWIWKAGKSKYGYGKFATTHGGIVRHLHAHQVAFFLATNEWPHPLWVLHSCDNPPCCNPSDLFKGTPRDNMQDKVSKNRQSHGEKHSARMKQVAARGSRNAAYTKPDRVLRGEAHGNARLTDDAVRMIRASSDSTARLARVLKVGESTVRRVRQNEYWKHVT